MSKHGAETGQRRQGQGVCAVVVTFRPRREMVANLVLLLREVDHLVVVDNTGSEPAGGPTAAQMLREASAQHGFTLLENPSNLGIAAALNEGAKWAGSRGYQWVLFLDQDSTIVPGFTRAMLDEYEHHRRRNNVGIFCPRYLDRASGMLMPAVLDRDSGLAIARTSGSLMPIWVFRKCGWFVEQLIIDQVDYEYCLRLRRMGYEIAEAAGATLIHSLGKPRTHRLFGVRLFRTTNHSAARRYYLVRNRVWLLTKYWRRYPRWCLESCLATLKETAKILLVEERRWSKLANTMHGIYDGARGRMGMTVRL